MSVKKAAEATPNILLRRARQERGWSQKELADLLGVPQSFMISRWENGTTYPGPEYREKLRSIFGKRCEELGLYKSVSPYPSQIPVIDPAIPVRQPGTSVLVGRDLLLEQIKQSLCSGWNSRFVAMNGLPGIGKTALAMELAVAAEMKDHFQDGVLWTTLGPRPDCCKQLRRWASLLHIKEPETTPLKSREAWAQELHQALASRRMLLILDDVWNIEDALAYMIGGPCCSYLLTTRIPEVATRFAGQQAFQIPPLTVDEGMHLLKQMVPALVEKEWDAVSKLTQASGGLPLTLILMGNYLLVQMRHRQRRRIQSALGQLLLPEERMRLMLLQPMHDYDIPLNIQDVIKTTEILLDDVARCTLYALSVFPAWPATFSEDAALAVTATSRDALDRLVEVGLLECNEEDRYLLHQSISDYAVCQGANPAAEKRLIAYVQSYVKEHEGEEKLLERESSIILAALRIAAQKGYHMEPGGCDSF